LKEREDVKRILEAFIEDNGLRGTFEARNHIFFLLLRIFFIVLNTFLFTRANRSGIRRVKVEKARRSLPKDDFAGVVSRGVNWFIVRVSPFLKLKK
jgi:hypothetical protein